MPSAFRVREPSTEASIYTAGADLNGHRAVIMGDNGLIYHADNTTSTHKERILGITEGAISNGQQGPVRRSGPIMEPTWTWTMGTAIFLSTNGQLTQTPPVTGFLIEIGYPTASNAMIVQLGEAVILA
jgi:hypothetical protein